MVRINWLSGKASVRNYYYNRRRLVGKTMAVGGWKNLTVGRRQKKKAMSWRPKGSKALSLLRIVELNERWQQLWFPAQAS